MDRRTFFSAHREYVGGYLQILDNMAARKVICVVFNDDRAFGPSQ